MAWNTPVFNTFVPSFLPCNNWKMKSQHKQDPPLKKAETQHRKPPTPSHTSCKWNVLDFVKGEKKPNPKTSRFPHIFLSVKLLPQSSCRSSPADVLNCPGGLLRPSLWDFQRVQQLPGKTLTGQQCQSGGGNDTHCRQETLHLHNRYQCRTDMKRWWCYFCPQSVSRHI